MDERPPCGTKQRVSACRKRLRQGRAMQKALRLPQDETNPASDKTLHLVSANENVDDSENVFEEAGASKIGTAHRFTPEVDRRVRLRAR